MSHRVSLRTLLTPTIVALALGGCSFSYSSGSSPPRSSSSRSNHGKPVPNSGGRAVDNREKALPRSSGSGSKPIPKATNTAETPPKRDTPTTADNDAAVDPPKRDTTPPRRTKVPPRRATPGEPVEPTDPDSADVDAPKTNDTIRANPTASTKPPATNNTIRANPTAPKPPATNDTIRANPTAPKPPATNNTLVAPR